MGREKKWYLSSEILTIVNHIVNAFAENDWGLIKEVIILLLLLIVFYYYKYRTTCEKEKTKRMGLEAKKEMYLKTLELQSLQNHPEDVITKEISDMNANFVKAENEKILNIGNYTPAQKKDGSSVRIASKIKKRGK